MVPNNFTCLTSFKSHQPWRVGIVLLIFQQRNLGLAGISPPDHTACSIQIRTSLTEGLSSQPRVSSQGWKTAPTCPARHRLCPPSWGRGSSAHSALGVLPEPHQARMLKIARDGKPRILTYFLSLGPVLWFGVFPSDLELGPQIPIKVEPSTEKRGVGGGGRGGADRREGEAEGLGGLREPTCFLHIWSHCVPEAGLAYPWTSVKVEENLGRQIQPLLPKWCSDSWQSQTQGLSKRGVKRLCSAQPGEREGEEGQEFFTKRSQHSNTVLTIIFTVWTKKT